MIFNYKVIELGKFLELRNKNTQTWDKHDLEHFLPCIGWCGKTGRLLDEDKEI